MNIKIGDIVSGVGSENIEVTLIKQVGSRLILDGFGKSSNKHVSIPLTADQAEALKVIRSAESGYTYDGDARAFLLGTEALRINSAYQFDPLFAVSSSIVDPLPHQIEAVYKYLLPLPKIRFLLADDTGAGKTIMTGLLLKELLFRGTIERILIVTPAGLTKQWQEDELSGKFGLSFILVDRVNRTRDPDILNNNNFCIASIDFLRQPDVRDMLGRTKRWDIVVVDEAHKPAAYKYGNKLEENDRYKVIKILSDKTDHLLLLTATPHRGRKDTFRYLLQLLDRDLFQKDELVKKHITNTDSDGRNRFFLRRLKEEMVDWNGKPLFKPRYTKTVGYTLTEEESDFYEQITQYVRTRKRAAKEQKNRNVELALIVLQRRLASSLYAVTKTLENRKKSIEYVLDLIINNPDVIKKLKKQIEEKLNDEGVEDIEDIEGLDDEKRQIVEDLILRSTLSTDPEDIQDEIDELKRLLNIAYSLKNHEESKYIQLKKLLDESDVIRDDKEKLVIFTEYYDTLTILQKRLEESGYQVTTIHGGMDLDERKEAQVKFFHDAKILIATDAAGEGINLQFCHYLINWDIPWNPNRLEQRMGRIHRYGQKSDVHVFNLVASNTREGIVLQTILKKLDVMREQLGTDRVYDVIDELLSEVSLTKLIENAIDEDPNIIKAKLSVFDQENTTLNKKAEDLISEQKSALYKTEVLWKSARELKELSDEKRLQPLYVERFFLRAFEMLGGKYSFESKTHLLRIIQIPNSVRDFRLNDKRMVSDKYSEPFVFDKSLLSPMSPIKVPETTRLLGPGHELFNSVIEVCKKFSQESFIKGVTLIDPVRSSPAFGWLIRSIISDDRPDERRRIADEQLALVVHDKEFKYTSPAHLLDCVVSEEEVKITERSERSNDEVIGWIFETLSDKQLADIQKIRNDEYVLRKNYLEHALQDLILDDTDKLTELEQKELFGQDTRKEQDELSKHIEDLKIRRAKRIEELEQMMHLHPETPEVMGSIRFIPLTYIKDINSGTLMHRDDEVERIAMEEVMRYESTHGRTPTDVSSENLGYDIRSISSDGLRRYIEVKGRAQTGDICLSENELNRLKQLQESSWLYIVTECKTDKPSVVVIQNPGNVLSVKEVYKQVQYLVEEQVWKKEGVKE